MMSLLISNNLEAWCNALSWELCDRVRGLSELSFTVPTSFYKRV